jgi:Calx-beta domain
MRHTLITTLALVALGVIALPLTASSATQKGKDTGGPLTGGSVSCKATAGAKALTHTQSLRGGVARCSFTLPLTATSVRVALTVKAGTQSASRTFTFAVRPAPKPALSIGDVTVSEGNAGTTTMSFPVTLSKAGTQTVSVSWSTADGTATAPVDYAAGNGSLTFAPGETSKSIAVSVVGDLAIEPDETLTVTLANPVNATIATGSATGTIRNEDTQVPVVSGSYKGQLPSGDFLYFEVTQARQVSYFRLNDLRENCSPYGYFEGSVSYPPTALWPISASGSAGAFSTWTGTETYGSFTFTHYEYRTTVQFDGTATVKGTIQLKDEFDYSGSHFSCDTGVLAWTAAKVG